ncbi:uncharacterized protein LOC115874418 [Sitophilus oryzae]|uniref:Uncharacterized protein LOC115874418 n=1 Tax=Sitophilus oryzae TaxID=7048 RepID=A0A6J2X2I1_SITOR|nr:uncharacterized protein LOC115874418 [Sitophilus oryzae]
MISSKEKLLSLPWQQRKYENHKRKIQTAVPVVDNKSPPHRRHVAVKLKKLQKEDERSRRIEKDNLILLRRLNHIMTNHWLDNYLPPQPNFLNRVKIFETEDDSGIDIVELARSIDLDMEEIEDKSSKEISYRKLKCIACSPIKILEPINVPEERVPWEPQKKKIGRSRSVPPRRSVIFPSIVDKPKSAAVANVKQKSEPEVKETTKTTRVKTREKPALRYTDPSRITLTRGSLKLSLNFPVDTVVNIDRKQVISSLCKCSSHVAVKI